MITIQLIHGAAGDYCIVLGDYCIAGEEAALGGRVIQLWKVDKAEIEEALSASTTEP